MFQPPCCGEECVNIFTSAPKRSPPCWQDSAQDEINNRWTYTLEGINKITSFTLIDDQGQVTPLSVDLLKAQLVKRQ